MGGRNEKINQLAEGTDKYVSLCLNNLILLPAGISKQLVEDPGFSINISQAREGAGALLQQFTSRHLPKVALQGY